MTMINILVDIVERNGNERGQVARRMDKSGTRIVPEKMQQGAKKTTGEKCR